MIHWAEPDVGQEEKEILESVIDSGWIGGNGPLTKKFEEQFANKVNVKHSIAVCNGTCGLIAGLLALKKKLGELRIAVPTFTFIATATSASLITKNIQLVDCKKTTFNIDPNKIGERNNVVMPVDVGGLPCDYDEILEMGKIVFEDSAEALEAEYKGKKVGSIGDVTLFSFHAAKVAATGEGGMLTTNNTELHNLMRQIVNQGYPLSKVNKWEYSHNEFGLNFRMTEMQSALGIVQLSKLDKYLRHREEIAKIYYDVFQDKVGFQEIPKDRKSSRFLFPILVPEKKQMGICQELLERGIETKITWKPVHLQEALSYMISASEFRNAEWIWRRVISLPIHNKLTEEQAKYVAQSVLEILKH